MLGVVCPEVTLPRLFSVVFYRVYLTTPSHCSSSWNKSSISTHNPIFILIFCLNIFFNLYANEITQVPPSSTNSTTITATETQSESVKCSQDSTSPNCPIANSTVTTLNCTQAYNHPNSGIPVSEACKTAIQQLKSNTGK